MKKKFCILFILLFKLSLFAISIADFSLQYQKNGRFYNFYDNPSELFDLLGNGEVLDKLKIGDSRDYYFDICSFSVLCREFDEGTVSSGQLYQLEHEFKVKSPKQYYNIMYLEVYKDFKTIRGIGIDDNINDVLEKYPEAKLFKNNRKYKWEESDCYYEEQIDRDSNISDIGYILLSLTNWQYNRSFETDWPVHYELVFVIKDFKVKSIEMLCILDAV